MAVAAFEPRAHHVRAVVVVDFLHVVAAQVDDRQVHVVAFVVQPALVRDGPVALGRVDAVGRRVVVDRAPTDVLVQVDELRRRDRAGLQRAETILHADVVERRRDEPVAERLLDGPPELRRALAELVDEVRAEIAAHAARIGLRVVGLVGPDTLFHVAALQIQAGRAIGLAWIAAFVEAVDVDPRLANVRAGMAFHRGLLVRGPRDPGRPLGRIVEIVYEQPAVDDLDRGRPRIRERARRQDAVEDAGIVVRGLLLVDRAARAAAADRVADRAVLLDDALLRHHHRLGLHDEIAVLRVVVERGGPHHEPALQRLVDHHVGRDGLAVMRAAARAAGDVGLAVPAGLRRPRRPRLRRVEQHRDLILAAILRAGFASHDVRNGLALVGRRRADVARRVVRVVRLEAAAAARHVLVVVDHGPIALRVGRAGQARPRLDLRAGEDRPAVRVVGDRDRRAAGLALDGQRVGAVDQAGHEAHDAAIRAQRESAADVGAVQRGPEAARPGVEDFYQRVAAADQVGLVGEHLDRRAGPGRQLRFGEGREARRKKDEDDTHDPRGPRANGCLHRSLLPS